MTRSDIDIRFILIVLQRKKHIFFSTVGIVSLLALIVIANITPLYTAETLVYFNPRGTNVLKDEQGYRSAQADSARVDSEVEIIRSKRILSEVAEKLDLEKSGEFGAQSNFLKSTLKRFNPAEETKTEAGANGITTQTVERLANRVSVRRVGLTYTIKISATSRTPEMAQNIANQVATSYVDNQVKAKVARVQQALNVLRPISNYSEERLAFLETERRTFIDNNFSEVVSLTDRSDLHLLRDKINTLDNMRSQIALTIAALQKSYENQETDGLSAKLLDTIALQIEYLAPNDGRGGEAKAENASYYEELNKFRTKLFADSNRLIKDHEALPLLQDKIKISRNIVANLDNEKSDLTSELMEEVIAELPAQRLNEFYRLNRNAENALTISNSLSSRSVDLEVLAATQVADSAVISPALLPAKSEFPNKQLLTVGSFLSALCLGVVAALTMDGFAGGFTDEDYMSDILELDTAITISKTTIEPEWESLADRIIDTPLSSFSESIRKLRSQINIGRAEIGATREANVIMVSSALPDEGKTSIALALARSYASYKQGTVLVDCDFRRPNLHNHVGMPPNEGLMEFLAGGSPEAIRDCVSKDKMKDLTLILGAGDAHLPTDYIFEQANFSRLLTHLKANFSTVIIDTPPLDPVLDGLHISRFVDVMVHVADWDSGARHIHKKSIKQVREKNTGRNLRYIGVLNKTEGLFPINQQYAESDQHQRA